MNIKSIKFSNFINNNCELIKSINSLTIIPSDSTSQAEILVQNINPIPGEYTVDIDLTTNYPVYWNGTYENSSKVQLVNGNNTFIIKIMDEQKSPFSIRIFTDILPPNEKFYINKFSINKLNENVTQDNNNQRELNNMSQNNKKISIVMSYVNRRAQLETTLKTIHRSSHKNIEIIITDDGSSENEQIDDFIDKYDIILIKTDQKKKTHINPVIGYNKALFIATGDIIIIQNPEVCHIGDVVSYVVNNITETNYISFSCLALPNPESNNILNNALMNDDKLDIDTLLSLMPKSLWYNHPIIRAKHFHFCSAMTKNNVHRVRAFSPEYSDGYWYDDDDLILKIRRIIKLDMSIISPSILYVIHQHHSSSMKKSVPYEIKKKQNEKIFKGKLTYLNKLSESLSYKIPRIFNSYWDLSKLSFLSYLSVKSFSYYNPEWLINIYLPIKKHDNMSETSNELKIKYIGKDYWDDLLKISNINVIRIDFEEIGFSNSASKITKSNYLKWHILSSVGGIWSDMDILHINSVDNTIFKKNNDFDTLIFNMNEYFPTKFFISKSDNNFFKELKELTLQNGNTGQYTIDKIIKNKWSSIDEIIKHFPENKFIVKDKKFYIPFEYSQLNNLFYTNNMNILNEETIGICWFGESDISGNYTNKFQNEIKNENTISILVNQFLDIIKNDSFNKNIVILNPNYLQ